MKRKPVLVYVTHEHGDHYDEETLKHLIPAATEFCIPNYENAFFKNQMTQRLGIARSYAYRLRDRALERGLLS